MVATGGGGSTAHIFDLIQFERRLVLDLVSLTHSGQRFLVLAAGGQFLRFLQRFAHVRTYGIGRVR